ncbi:hypothetical protein OG604_01875 [Streptomyces sp. NBC_01231]|nr:hypothetical protein OG604_01875 [Streptomyces sp. NBC_01231]
MTEQITDLLDSWHEGRIIDVPAEMRTLVSRVVVRSLFTVDCAEPAAVAIKEVLPELTKGLYRHEVTPTFKDRLSTPGNRRLAPEPQSRHLARRRQVGGSS